MTATVQVDSHSAYVTAATGRRCYPICEMPEEFFRWQVSSRVATLESLERRRPMTEFHAHLPVVASYNEQLRFPVHTATKATGLLPTDAHLDYYGSVIAECLQEVRGEPWEESLATRIAAAIRLYTNAEHIDRRKLGLVEIFQGQTYRNLLHNPLAAIQYTGPGPEYRSYQLNGVMEAIGPGDPRLEFLRLMRRLFEYDSFHVQQPAYPSGYLFWVCEVFDKSPRKQAGRRMA